MKKEEKCCLYVRFSTADAASENLAFGNYNVLADKKKKISIGGKMTNGKVSSSYSGNEKDALK